MLYEGGGRGGVECGGFLVCLFIVVVFLMGVRVGCGGRNFVWHGENYLAFYPPGG